MKKDKGALLSAHETIVHKEKYQIIIGSYL
jgi:hypothetical protein